MNDQMPPHLEPAPRHAVEPLFQALRSRLPPLSRRRVEQLMEVMDESGRINYAEAYARLFPGAARGQAEKTRADKAFAKFRSDLKKQARSVGVMLELKVDQNRNAAPADRGLWFVVADDARRRLAPFNRGGTGSLTEHAQEQTLRVRDRELSYLLVYAEEERKEALAMHRILARRFEARGLKWEMLDYHHVLPGESIDETRHDYLRQARFVLFCLSPALIATQLRASDSPFHPDRPLIPVALKHIDHEQLVGTVLQEIAIATDDEGKAWTQRKASGRDTWTDRVARAIEKSYHQDRSRTRGIFAALDQHISREGDCPEERYVPQQLKELNPRKTQPEEGHKALPFLLDWLNDSQGSILCALFGELGMGKTTLSQRLTQKLMERCESDPDAPFPVYLDLRRINSLEWRWEGGAPSLELILQHILTESFDRKLGTPTPTVDDVRRLAQQQGGLVIFDGLDEVMNRLTPHQCDALIERLWSILPPVVWKGRERPPGCGRLLMTCRSHFYQTLQDQLSALAGRQRAAVGETDYLWVNLVPFDARQIETYFHQVFPDSRQAEAVIAMLDEIHNLRELAARPYNLALIQGQVERLEAIQRGGGRVNVADLYEGMVGQWSRRDDPKHRLKRDHKLLLMERLAHLLWAGGRKALPYGELEEWLLDELLAQPRWQLNYRSYLNRDNGTDILQEDLRNASFLVREGEDSFRFAHTSIMEFFLARALYRALREEQPEQWALPRPSPESLDFLGQLLSRDGEAGGPALEALAGIGLRGEPAAAELALAYCLHARSKKLPAPEPAGFRLPGADLTEWRFMGSAEHPLRLAGIDLSGAKARRCRFHHCDLEGADFSGAALEQAEFLHCQLASTDLAHACLEGAVLRHCTLRDADLNGAGAALACWLHCDLTGQKGLELGRLSQRARCRPASFGDVPPAHSVHASAFGGHRAGVTACIFSPDGNTLLSASDDNSLRLWDARSGECLRVLRGHRGAVLACAISPDGNTLLSASGDHSLRLWDARSGECLRVLEGHQRWVRGCAFSPDGNTLLSASDDHSLRLWDVHSGKCLRRLHGHQDWVRGCAFSPNGNTVLSASDDHSLRLWDARSGKCLHQLDGHQKEVRGCAISPDGNTLLSASSDHSLRLWDAHSGDCRRRFEGHQDGVTGCAFSPDSNALLSASNDGSLRLWDALSGDCLRVLEGHQRWVGGCAFSPEGNTLLSASGDHSLRLWDARSGDCLRRLEGHQDGVTGCAFFPDGKTVLSASDDRSQRLWDARSGEFLHRLEGHRYEGTGCALSPDGKTFLSASDYSLCLWDVRSGNLREFYEHQSRVTSFAFSTDGNTLLSACDDGSLRLWDARSRDCLRVLFGHRNRVAGCAFSPDGNTLLSASGDTSLRLWDARSGDCLHVLYGHRSEVTGCAFSPDGNILLSASDDHSLRLWDARSGKCVSRLDGHQDCVTSCAFSPDGNTLLSASQDHSLRLWNAGSGECLRVLLGHQSGVITCVFSPDGNTLLSASNDSSLRLWNTATGEPIAVMHHLGPGQQAAVSGDGQRILHASSQAWRQMGWGGLDEEGRWRRYPLEIFGPISGLD